MHANRNFRPRRPIFSRAPRPFRTIFLSLLAVAWFAAPAARAQEYLPASEYYPTAPGSVWKYKKQTWSDSGSPPVETLPVVAFAPNYYLVDLHDPGSSCKQESFFVPLLGEFSSCSRRSENFIFGSQISLDGLAGCGLLVDLIRTEVGATWYIPRGTGGRCGGGIYRCDSRTVVSNDTSLLISGVLLDSLLHIRETRLDMEMTTDDFYRKGTGLVFESVWKGNLPAHSEMELLEYVAGTDPRKDQVIAVDRFSGLRTNGMPLVYWANLWTLKVPCINWNSSGEAESPMYVYMAAGKDTLQVESHSTSGLPTKISEKEDKPRLFDDDKLILEDNSWHGFRIEIQQPGNADFRPATAIKGIVCVVPRILIEQDTLNHSLRALDFPDSLISWTWSASGDYMRDSAGRGSILVPSKPGYYRAHIGTGAFTDSLCGGSYTLESDSFHVQEIPTRANSAPNRSINVSLTIFGTRISTGLPLSEFGVFQLRILDVKGNALAGVALSGKGRALEATPSAGLRPGLYFYQLRLGSLREHGRVFYGGESHQR